MKDKLIIVCLLTLFAFTSFSQDNTVNANRTDFRKRFLLGLKGGVNYSNVYDSQGEEFVANSKLGLAAGTFISIPIGRYLGVQPEILYSEKGFKATGRILDNSYGLTRTTSYIDIPLLFALKPTEFITLVAGPQYSYLLKQKDVFTNSNTSIEQEKEFENSSVRKNTLCFIGGLDLTLKHMVIGARAGWDLQKNNSDGTTTTPRYKNVWYQLTVGYRFYNK